MNTTITKNDVFFVQFFKKNGNKQVIKKIVFIFPMVMVRGHQ